MVRILIIGDSTGDNMAGYLGPGCAVPDYKERFGPNLGTTLGYGTPGPSDGPDTYKIPHAAGHLGIVRAIRDTKPAQAINLLNASYPGTTLEDWSDITGKGLVGLQAARDANPDCCPPNVVILSLGVNNSGDRPSGQTAYFKLLYDTIRQRIEWVFGLSSTQYSLIMLGVPDPGYLGTGLAWRIQEIMDAQAAMVASPYGPPWIAGPSWNSYPRYDGVHEVMDNTGAGAMGYVLGCMIRTWL